jgi:hypothetical protein
MRDKLTSPKSTFFRLNASVFTVEVASNVIVHKRKMNVHILDFRLAANRGIQATMMHSGT